MNKNDIKSANPSGRGRRLGLTGGMGCGKSTVAGIFREVGFGVVESDALVRDLWEQDEEVKAAALKRWGGAVFQENGVIDRRKVAERVFWKAEELAWVEELLHPRVRARWEAALAANPGRDWVVEIPLLFEKSLASHFDLTLCVWASPATQAKRLVARGLTPTEMAARQARQWPVKEKAERADLVVSNDGSRDFLSRQVEWIAGRLPRPLL
jgi:dephospho-CoA kinase